MKGEWAMNKPTKPATKPGQENIELEGPPLAPDAKLPAPQSQIDAFVRRRHEVAEKDHAEFQGYLRRKAEENARKQAELVPAAAVEEKRKSRLSRRTMFNAAVGTAVVAEAAVLGYNTWRRSVSEQGLKHAGDKYTEAQRHDIVRELVDAKADVGGRRAWASGSRCSRPSSAAAPMRSTSIRTGCWRRSGIGTTATSTRSAHHLCAFPSADPYNGFEFVNSTQGGKNSLIYGIPTRHRRRPGRRHQHLPRAV